MKKIVITVLVMTMLTILVACGGQSESTSGNGSASNEEAPKSEEKKEELTPQQVITKSSEAMQDWPGMQYVVDGIQTINASKGEQKQTIDQKFTIDTKTTMDPITMHMTGNMTMQGQEVPVENYYVDGTMYTKAPQDQWIAIEGMNLDQLQAQSQGQNPSETMEQFTKMLDELSGEDKSSEFITMKEQDDLYVVELDLNEEASSKVMDIVKEQAKGTMQQLEKMGISDVMENMKIKSMNQTFYIDRETFEQKKMDQQMTMEMSMNGANMTIDMDISMDIKGKVDEKVTVPKDVKKKAQVVSMEQLQQAQQQSEQQAQSQQ
ncbi:DUF6612 family protein [Virgibacillus necropolis]|uniref:Lipoprotein n=1 Tax=Virgibacillus necropolis TaxID=163877 RepID=A0A221MER5_9BACI|nr:DUF6612 family protein [Virgibacillus necropolis]ASN06166.1 hypothetical protein CFK40_14625 [Virgibacillus necropolis]